MAGDDDRRVHALTIDVEPYATNPHLGPLVRGGVEVLRDGAVGVRHAKAGVLFLRDVAAEGDERFDEPLQRRAAVGRDLQRQPREVVVRFPDVEVLYLEGAPALDDRVEDRVQELRVDQVTFCLDDGGVVANLGHGPLEL